MTPRRHGTYVVPLLAFSNVSTMVLHSAQPQRRFLSLDVMRGLAVLSMIQGHTFTALLRPQAYDGEWSRWHTLIHGLTAPMFLLGGGLAYGLVTLRAGATREKEKDPTRLLRRALMLVAIGYALQIPRVPWSRIFAEHELLALTLRVGPLQLVGFCLLLCETLRLSLRSRAAVLSAVASCALATIGCAPWVWNARWSSHGPLAIGTWLDGYAGSLFPFFPWASFFFIGTLVSAWVLRARSAGTRNAHLGLTTGLVGLGLASAAFAYAMFITNHVMRNIYGAGYELWHTSPLYVLFRAGLVLACLGVLNGLEPWFQRLWLKVPTIDALFGVISKQSLVAYVTHLLVLYGTPFTKGLATFGTTLDMTEVVVTTGCVLLFTTSIAVIWNHAITSGVLKRYVLRLAGHVESVATVAKVDGIGKRQRLDTRTPEQHIETTTTARHGV